MSLQDLWESEECLGIDSVQFGDDRIAILDVIYPPISYLDDQDTIPSVRAKRWDSFDRFVEDGLKSWTVSLYDSVLYDFTLRSELLRCRAGECGGDGRFGFVSVFRIADDRLFWMAFFHKSNGFNSVRVASDCLIAMSSVGWEYVFDLIAPEQITIRKSFPHDNQKGQD